jgi:hypothetical protein
MGWRAGRGHSQNGRLPFQKGRSSRGSSVVSGRSSVWAGVAPVTGVKSRGSLTCTASNGSGSRRGLRYSMPWYPFGKCRRSTRVLEIQPGEGWSRSSRVQSPFSIPFLN